MKNFICLLVLVGLSGCVSETQPVDIVARDRVKIKQEPFERNSRVLDYEYYGHRNAR